MPPTYSYMMANHFPSHSFIEYGEHIVISLAYMELLFHLILGVDTTSFGFKFHKKPYLFGAGNSSFKSYFCLNFMALAPHQVSFVLGTLIGSKFNSEENLNSLYYQWISVFLHGPSIHLNVVYVPLSEHLHLLPKKNIPPYI